MNAIPTPKLDPREQHFRIPGPHRGLQLFLRRLEPVAARRARPVLYVHGGTFPSALSIAHRFDGYSWRDALCEAGFDVWGLDFHGFGSPTATPRWTSRRRRMRPSAAPPMPPSSSRPRVRFILEHTGRARLSLIAHSWGTLPTGRFAGAHPRSGRPPRAVRPDRPPHAGRRRQPPHGAGLADRDSRGPMGALHRGRAGRRAARSLARAFRRMGRALSRQRSRQPQRAIPSA